MANKNQKPRVPYVKAQIDRLVDDPNSKTRAYISATIGGAFAIHGIRVVESDKGRFMAMPSRSYQDKDGNTQYAEYFHSISKEGYQALNKAVTTAYENEISQTEDSDIEVIDDDIEDIEQSM